MIYARDESERRARNPSPLVVAIRRRATRLAIILGAGLFVMMLAVSIAIRVYQFRMIGWEALRVFLRLDLPIIFVAAAAGALVGAVTGAILALVSVPRKKSIEPEKHPLD